MSSRAHNACDVSDLALTMVFAVVISDGRKLRYAMEACKLSMHRSVCACRTVAEVVCTMVARALGHGAGYRTRR